MALTFQDAIMKLHRFWAAQGCVLWQPYNVQVGAGTNNPATLLRVLGPEPWRVAYVEPSVRPDDGRYGENPNRMQYYFQYQVILKPDPGNPQEIYLQSLEALGINPREHDIRFVEDNWESPALGAWGLGWEVWLDGQEISQYTYFQQAGGINLEPVSVEITYGLERIVLAAQDVNAAWDIELTQGISYGDIFLRSEIEHCTYYFEVADVEGLRQTFDVYANEYERAIAHGLVIPAYDYVLKCSHLFNVLDTRGAIGVTERAQFFRRMRNMTRQIAKAYVEQREAMDHPFAKLNTGWTQQPPQPALVTDLSSPSAPADFLLEIGVEEMPAADVDAALDQITALAPEFFADLRLDYAGLESFATPRRIVLLATQVAPRQHDQTEEVRGPSAQVAFDAEGKPTKAAQGFARKYGIDAGQLQRRAVEGGEYVFAVIEHEGQPATEVLAAALPRLVESIRFGKSMRWNSSGVAFSRPIRWFVALYGKQVLPFTYAQVNSGATTRGLRPFDSPELPVQDVPGYFAAMKQQGILLDKASRWAAIKQQLALLAQEVNARVPDDPALLDEVVNLVERPTALRGAFPERFLALPREVLVTVMRDKQRYFSLENEAGELLPYFITIRNGDAEHLDKVAHGNEQVLIARFSDAEYFYSSDIKKPLGDYLERLSTLTFQEKLGSMQEKNQRVAALVRPFGELLGAADDLLAVAGRAAALAKADLATQMVVEMTALQGTMGRIYAGQSGESPEVATAIYEHWLPRGAGDALPSSAAGVLLALLDRLDSLVGLFAVNLAPTGSTDPFALRRAALGIVQILADRGLSLNLREAIALVAEAQPVPVDAAHQQEVLDFIIGRLRVWLLEQGEAHDVVEAILAEQGHNPARAIEGVQQLRTWTAQEGWENILDAFARCARILPEGETFTLRPAALQEPAEQALYQELQRIQQQLKPGDNIGAFLEAFAPAVPSVSRFFGDLMVMAEDASVRENRLALLQALTALTHNRAKLRHLSGF